MYLMPLNSALKMVKNGTIYVTYIVYHTQKKSLKHVFEGVHRGYLFSPQPAVAPAGFAAEPWSAWDARATGAAPLEGGDPAGPSESCGEVSSLLRRPEDPPTGQEGDLGAMSFNTQSPPWRPQGEATLCPWEGDPKTEPTIAAAQAHPSSDSESRRALQRERRKMIEKDILHKVPWHPGDPACRGRSPVEMPWEAAASGPRPEMPPEAPQEGPLALSLQVGSSPALCFLGASPARSSSSSSTGQLEGRPTAPVLV